MAITKNNGESATNNKMEKNRSNTLFTTRLEISIPKWLQKKTGESWYCVRRDAYDRLAVGERIRKKRIQLGFSQDEVAERIDRAPKYCSDIERGTCGMSTETMLAISDCLDISLDYMMFGEQTDEEAKRQEDDELAIVHILSRCTTQQREYAIRLLKLYIASMQIS